MAEAAGTGGVLGLPPEIATALDTFVGAARTAFGADLRSVVLYGSAAEGRLRVTSDVNLIVVLAAFEAAAVDRVREPLRVAEAAADAHVMFLLENEVNAAAEAFATKFSEVLRSRRVLAGTDPFEGLSISPEAEAARLRAESLNLVLRLRAAYASRSLREEQAAHAVADAAGPLRGLASSLLDLEGKPAPTPREALARLAQEVGPESVEALERLTEARTAGILPPGTAGPTLLRLIALAGRLRQRAAALR